jgi:hypothetical protein
MRGERVVEPPAGQPAAKQPAAVSGPRAGAEAASCGGGAGSRPRRTEARRRRATLCQLAAGGGASRRAGLRGWDRAGRGRAQWRGYRVGLQGVDAGRAWDGTRCRGWGRPAVTRSLSRPGPAGLSRLGPGWWDRTAWLVRTDSPAAATTPCCCRLACIGRHAGMTWYPHASGRGRRTIRHTVWYTLVWCAIYTTPYGVANSADTSTIRMVRIPNGAVLLSCMHAYPPHGHFEKRATACPWIPNGAGIRTIPIRHTARAANGARYRRRSVSTGRVAHVPDAGIPGDMLVYTRCMPACWSASPIRTGDPDGWRGRVTRTGDSDG